jgi:hypothetical protein
MVVWQSLLNLDLKKDSGIEMPKINCVNDYENLYNPPSTKIVVVDVPEFNFLMVDGTGPPNASETYEGAIEALFKVSCQLRSIAKKGKLSVENSPMPIEGLWWTECVSTPTEEKKVVIKWTALVMQPNLLSQEMLKDAVESASKGKNLPAIRKLRFESFREGLSAQTMYIGRYSAEKPTLDKIQEFINENSYIRTGKHHEIYFTDPRMPESEETKTIIRWPIKRKQ